MGGSYKSNHHFYNKEEAYFINNALQQVKWLKIKKINIYYALLGKIVISTKKKM